MGVNFLWRDFSPSPKSLVELCAEFHSQHGQPPRVAIDVSQMLFHASEEKSSANAHIEHRILIRRFAAFVAAGVAVTCVFDSPSTLVKRGLTVRRQESTFTAQVREIVTAFGFAVVNAAGEAEAQCAALQQDGTVDFVFSNDADVLANGARAVIKYSSDNDSSNTAIERLIDEIHVGRPAHEYVLRAVLQGCDWNDGVRSIGSEYARNIAETPGMSDEFVKIAQGYHGHLNLVRGTDWWNRLVEKLERGEFGRRNTQLSNFGHREKEKVVLALLKSAKRLVDPVVLKSIEDTGSATPDWFTLMQIWLGESAAPPKGHRPVNTKQKEKTESEPTKKRNVKTEFANAIAPALVSWNLLHMKQRNYNRMFTGPPRLPEMPWLGNIEVVGSRALSAVHFDWWPLEDASIPRPGSIKVMIPTYIARKKASILIVKKALRSPRPDNVALPPNNMSLLDVFGSQRKVQPSGFKVEKRCRRKNMKVGNIHDQHFGSEDIF